MAAQLDVIFENHGSIWLADPRTEAAMEWIRDNVTGSVTWIAGRLLVEPRYVAELVEGMQLAGLEVGN
jgi:hypothetical protein